MSYTVMLVDDEPHVRSSLRRTLRGEGYEFVEAEGPQEALALLKERKVDLIISDLAMPGMGGIEFIKIVRFRWPDCVRIILTGNADLEAAIQAINDGSVHRFLRKPWDTVDVKVMIRLALRSLESTRENERLLETVRAARPAPASSSDHPAPAASSARAAPAHPLADADDGEEVALERDADGPAGYAVAAAAVAT